MKLSSGKMQLEPIIVETSSTLYFKTAKYETKQNEAQLQS